MTDASAVENHALDEIGDPDRSLPVWVDRVSKWYGAVIGVNEITLRVESGIVALLGPNGAGKSTFIKLLTGQLRPSIGHVRIFGRSVRSPAARRKLGYCPDVDAFYEEMTGRQFVTAMARLSGFTPSEAADRVEASLATVGMNDSQGERRANKRLRGCSKGMRQRIKLAQALVHDPQLLILDEPLSGLDPVGRAEFCELFRRLADAGKTLLISSHVLHEVEQFADRVALVSEGRLLVDGVWSEVAKFLDDLPHKVDIECARVRELAAQLLLWPGVMDVAIAGECEAVVTTRDPAHLADEVGRLVRERGFDVRTLRPRGQWAEALFKAAKDS